MSIRLIADVWDNGPSDATECNVLVCLANFANDQGLSCRPSIAKIAAMARRSQRTVERTIQTLETSGWLTVERGTGRGNASSYALNVARLKERNAAALSVNKRATPAQAKGDIDAGKSATGAGKGDIDAGAHKEEPSGTVKATVRGSGEEEPAPFPEGLSELQYASGIFEHCHIVDTFRLRDTASKALVVLSRMESLPLHNAGEVLQTRIVEAQARGDTINAFWFEDAKWKRASEGISTEGWE